jgi:hypothetical protein
MRGAETRNKLKVTGNIIFGRTLLLEMPCIPLEIAVVAGGRVLSLTKLRRGQLEQHVPEHLDTYPSTFLVSI